MVTNVLLTRKTLACIVKAFQYGEYFSAHPFKWNTATSQLEIVTSRRKLALWIVNLILSNTYFVFTVVQLYKTDQDPNIDVLIKIVCVFGFLVLSLIPCNSFLIVWRMQEIPHIFNQYLDYVQELQGNALKNYRLA